VIKKMIKPETRVAVLGGGSWGTTVAIHLWKKGYAVKLWEYFPENVLFMNKTHRNPLLEGIPIPHELPISAEIAQVVSDADFCIIAVPAQTVRALLNNLRGRIREGTVFVNLAKGIESDSLKRMSELIAEILPHSPHKIVTLHGPSHAEEVAREIPTAVVAAGIDSLTTRLVQELFRSDYFRVYTNSDIVGVEIGGAVKNVIAIAAGICDGMNLGDNTKAALMTRGLLEITRLGVRLGGQEATFAGLSGVGDLIVTCGSKHSRNRYVGEEIGKGRKLHDVLDGMSMVAEGVMTCRTVHQMAEKYEILMPLSSEIYKILFEGKAPRQAMRELMTRDPVAERHSFPK